MSFLSRLKLAAKKTYASFKRFKKSHPIQLVMLIICTIILGSQIAIAVNMHNKDVAQREVVQNLPEINLQEFNQLASKGEIKEIISHDVTVGTWMYPEKRSYLQIITQDGDNFKWERTSGSILGDEFNKMLFNNAVSSEITFSTGATATENSLLGVLKIAGFVILIVLVLVAAQSMVTEVLGGHSFKAQKPDRDTNLDDVIGYDDVKNQLKELKEQLVNYRDYEARGITPPRGILFTGGPGVGKTLLAKAFANELEADFYTCAGSDFAEMYVGVGPKRVRALFKLARMSANAVIFIDEIDALGSRDTMGNDTERLSTLNAMLSEMDGVNGNNKIIVIAATNNPHKLDNALKRPGRFDRSVHIPLPDTDTREKILAHYLGSKDADNNIDLRALALRTQGYSGAQLKNVVLEAKRLAASSGGGADGKWIVTQDMLHTAQEIAMLGVTQNKSDGEDLLRVAVHELGHALAGYLLCPELHIEKVTVRGRGAALGYALSRPIDDKKLITKEQMENRIVMMLAGRASEEIVLGGVSGGASDDISKANDLARQMVLSFGMGDKTAFAQPQIRMDGQWDVSQSALDDINAILNKAYDRAKDIITQNINWVKDNTENLMLKGMVAHDELFGNIKRDEKIDDKQKWVKSILEQTQEKVQEKIQTINYTKEEIVKDKNKVENIA